MEQFFAVTDHNCDNSIWYGCRTVYRKWAVQKEMGVERMASEDKRMQLRDDNMSYIENDTRCRRQLLFDEEEDLILN